MSSQQKPLSQVLIQLALLFAIISLSASKVTFFVCVIFMLAQYQIKTAAFYLIIASIVYLITRFSEIVLLDKINWDYVD